MTTPMPDGHREALALAQALADLRSAPPEGLDALRDLPWRQFRSIGARRRDDGVEVVVEIADARDLLAPPASTSVVISSGALTDAICGLEKAVDVDGVAVLVSHAGWTVTGTPITGAMTQEWSGREPLTISGDDLPEFAVMRDADENERGLYTSQLLIRTAMGLRHAADTMPEGLVRHWTLVDAEIILRLAERENPVLNPGFRPGLRLVA